MSTNVKQFANPTDDRERKDASIIDALERDIKHWQDQQVVECAHRNHDAANVARDNERHSQAQLQSFKERFAPRSNDREREIRERRAKGYDGSLWPPAMLADITYLLSLIDSLRTAPSADIDRLILNLDTASFDCGAWDNDDEDGPYKDVLARRDKAKLELEAAIRALRDEEK